MTKALFRDTLRAIRKTLSRFVSIVIIVALGVGFFAGLKAVSPNMKSAAEDLFSRLNLADIVVQSTVGFDENDVAAVLALPGVENVTLSRSIDGILYNTEGVIEQGMTGTAYVMRVIGYDFDQAPGSGRLNQLELVEGRFPEKANECVVSVYENTNDKERYVIGQNLKVMGDHEDMLDTVENEIYTVVGTVYTPEFVSMELGSSTKGGGELSGYIYIPDSAFKLDYYTTMYVSAKGADAFVAYTEEYNEMVRGLQEQVEAVASDVVRQRVQRIENTFLPQIEAGKKELEEKKAAGLKQLEEGKAQLDEAKEFALNGDAMIAAEEAAGRKQLEDGWAEYNANKKKYDASLAEYNAGAAEYNVALDYIEENYPNAVADLAAAKSKLERAKNSYEIAELAVRAGRSALRVATQALASSDPERIENAMNIFASYLPMTEEDKTVEGLQKRVDEATIELSYQEEALAQADADIKAAEKEIAETEAELAKFDSSAVLLIQGKADLDAAKKKLEDGLAELQAGEIRMEVEIEEAWLKLDDVRANLDKYQAEYDAGVAEYEQGVADAERKIRIAENQMAALPNAQWITTTRDHFAGYTNYGDTSENMENFALIFPVLFFLVAALMSLTTMTRMVEEERMQLGVLKSAGYSGWAIAFKYLFYAFAAGLLGCIIGTILGFTLIPIAVFTAYQILYLIPTMRPGFFFGTAMVGFVFTMLSTVGAVILSVLNALRYRPAELMRPKAPKAGKRVFLELFPFIWKRLGFNGKVTVRNLARNKKRALMTFAGIMLCTALLLTGFGIGNSIGTMMGKQFGTDSIMKFDGQVMLQGDMRSGDETVLQVFDQPGRIQSAMPAYIKKMYASVPESANSSFERQIDVTIAVPENKEIIPEFVQLEDDAKLRPMTLNDAGCFIGGKLAEVMGLGIGDTIQIQSGADKALVKIAGIYRNYVYHYIYMSDKVYREAFGLEETTYNMMLIKLEPELNRIDKGSDAEIAAVKDARAQLARDLSDTAEVITVIYNQAIVDSVDGMIQLMKNVIVSVFIVAAGLLAFVVLYNLNNINIYERIRELATIKVLGFYDKEADMFIYRENIIISILGILGGLALGVPIHGFIIRTAEIESMMFVRSLAPQNFLASAFITAAFAFAVNALMHKKIQNISMVESLKSVE